MAKAEENKASTKAAKERWASDVIVDLLHAYGLPHAALNPGASYRGLHDSIVNYGQNRPTMMLCQHEETAVQIAHGYAKASGEPMVAILHNLVGLLHANMAIYYAYIDRAPIFIIGATGPMDETKRRPRIDWIHTAQGQGEAVRAYTKWDYQPHTIAGVPEAFARAYAVMMSEPKGPIYMCYDAWLQERKLDHEVPLPPPHAAKVPSRIAPDPKALAAAADLIASAKKPVIIAEFVGRDPEGFHALVELAETGGLPVYDVDSRLNFPTRHPLNMSMEKDVFRDADLVLCLDTRDWERPTTELAIKTEDWVLTAGTLDEWARMLWDFDKPYRHPGKSLGTATQFGISLGVALAHRDKKRVVVDLQPDGDLMFDAGAMWVAAKHRIPLLVVMYNNRAYYNDWEHQIRMAKLRGTPVARAHIGMDMSDPDPDFASMAKSMGWYAEGPIDKPQDVAAALKRAIAKVKAGQPALLDTITQKR